MAGQHFAIHYPASMNRVNELKNESKGNNADNNQTINNLDNTNSVNIDNDNNVSTKSESKDESNQLQCQIAEEKAAAKIFPLSLISNRFKSKDPDTLKGKLIYIAYLSFIILCRIH